MSLSAQDAAALQSCVAGGGVAVFPADTVYGLCCDPASEPAARRLYALKGRPAKQASAVMFFTLQGALAELGDDLRDLERAALKALLPGPVTLLLANRGARFEAACAADPATLGLRVPALPASLGALEALSTPVLQSSANLSGQPDARVLAGVPRALLEGADLVLDGGELPGTPSTVIDLRELHSDGRWMVVREGALPVEAVAQALGPIG